MLQAVYKICNKIEKSLIIIPLPPGPTLNLGTTYHDVVEQNRIEEKRRDERCVCCTQNEANFWVYYRPFGCRGLLKEEDKRRILRTWPPHSSPILRSLGGALPQARNLIGACSLYRDFAGTSRLKPRPLVEFIETSWVSV